MNMAIVLIILDETHICSYTIAISINIFFKVQYVGFIIFPVSHITWEHYLRKFSIFCFVLIFFDILQNGVKIARLTV